MRKIIPISLTLLLVLPLSLFLVGGGVLYYKQDEVLQRILNTVNEGMEGSMQVGAVRLAPFDQFPYVSVDLRQVRFFGSKDLDQRPLYTFDDLYLGFDIRDIVAGRYDIRRLTVAGGHLDVIQGADGTFNILSAKGLGAGDPEISAGSEDPSNLHLSINALDIRDVDITFHNEGNGDEVTLLIDDLAATIRYQQRHLYIDAVSDMHLDIQAQGVPDYFTDVAIHLDLEGDVDDSDFHFSGSLDNYPKWFQDNPMGDSNIEFDLVSAHFSLADLLSYKGENYVPESYRDEIFRDTKLHGRVALHYDQGLQSVDLYLDELSSHTEFHPLKLENFKGRAHYENEHLSLEEFSGQMGESDFTVTLSYFLGEGSDPLGRKNVMALRSAALDLDALTGYEEDSEPVDHAEAFNIFEVPFPNLKVDADIGRLNYHRYWLENVNLALRLQDDHYLYVDNLAFNVAGGGLRMTGYFNGSDPEHIYYHSDIQGNRPRS